MSNGPWDITMKKLGGPRSGCTNIKLLPRVNLLSILSATLPPPGDTQQQPVAATCSQLIREYKHWTLEEESRLQGRTSVVTRSNRTITVTEMFIFSPCIYSTDYSKFKLTFIFENFDLVSDWSSKPKCLYWMSSCSQHNRWNFKLTRIHSTKIYQN